MPDILFILLLAVVMVGPKKLPEIARQVGKLTAQFRMMSNEVKHQLESEMRRTELGGERKEAGDRSSRTETLPQSPPP